MPRGVKGQIAGELKSLDITIAVGRQIKTACGRFKAEAVEHFNELHVTVSRRENFLHLPKMKCRRRVASASNHENTSCNCKDSPNHRSLPTKNVAPRDPQPAIQAL